MKKKIMLSVLFSAICILMSTVCFATTNDSNKNNTMTEKIGNEITSSIKETEKSVDNLVNTDVVNNVNKGLNKDDDKDNSSKKRSDMTNDVDKEENKIVAGTTGNYNAGETATTSGNGMSVTTWVWIILAVLAVIIIAAVWYYAAQRND